MTAESDRAIRGLEAGGTTTFTRKAPAEGAEDEPVEAVTVRLRALARFTRTTTRGETPPRRFRWPAGNERSSVPFARHGGLPGVDREAVSEGDHWEGPALVGEP